jgi:four helix bundle protein
MRALMADFKDLQVWQRSRQLSKVVYHATARFPREELFGMTAQLRAASVSIVANIAEGSARHTLTDQSRFYRMAIASSREAEALLILAVDLEWISAPSAQPLFEALDGIQRMLSSLIRYCRRQPRPRTHHRSTLNPEP